MDGARELLLERARALLTMRERLSAWCRSCGYEPAAHHRLIIDALERLERGEIRKLMIALPPGSAKSTYGSVLYPGWYLARNPTHSIIAASHSMELAERWGRRVRNLIEERTVDLGIGVSETNRSAGRWQLAPTPEHRNPILLGEYLSVGSGTAVTGFRADLLIQDDPVKGREEVSSEGQREKLWEWYQYDLRTRLKPNARQVFIGTRWHSDDLAGRILQEEGDEWEQLVIPMLAEGNWDPLGRALGERLWPEWFTDEMVAVAQRDPMVWLSLYQQRPTSEEGTYWRRQWFHAVPPMHVPPRQHLRVYGGSDYATKAAGGDFTVHAVVGLDPEDRPWLLELWRQQTTSDVWVREWCNIVRHWRPMSWAEEQGQILSGVGPWLEREQIARQAWTERLQFPSRMDKGMRAQSMRAMVATRGLWYASDLAGRSDLEAELLSFPNARHDDVHDALGLVGQLLDMALKGRVPDKPKPKKPAPGYRPLRVVRPADTSRVV